MRGFSNKPVHYLGHCAYEERIHYFILLHELLLLSFKARNGSDGRPYCKEKNTGGLDVWVIVPDFTVKTLKFLWNIQYCLLAQPDHMTRVLKPKYIVKFLTVFTVI